MNVELIYAPTERELMLFKRCIWVTMGKTNKPKDVMNRERFFRCLRAQHSPIRVLNYAWLIKDIPSNIATHLARHVHAVPFVGSLRNDRQTKIDGDLAPRNTPVPMIFYCNAEELMTIAHKRLCMKASKKTREVVRMMCDEAIKATPELESLLVPACEWHNGKCYEIDSCGRWS